MSALRFVPYVPPVLLITLGLVMNIAAPSKASPTAKPAAALVTQPQQAPSPGNAGNAGNASTHRNYKHR